MLAVDRHPGDVTQVVQRSRGKARDMALSQPGAAGKREPCSPSDLN
jgi:hypothetical protein